jgi:hypothetical protein
VFGVWGPLSFCGSWILDVGGSMDDDGVHRFLSDLELVRTVRTVPAVTAQVRRWRL